ncbi:NADPH-dependent pterin aldehyde reductase-like isoform X4 [Benincasa hispida]|uniref:NADPH-dependent pterin aldehyde reductase-like isoform X4 n=1 Tax=Benincasa hispida TaxID=102211 RepID=UPI001901DE78|nr:NADPH-dependent pterin aldehyde reductase-like isoform X4 [Benincasa hispida]
MATILSEFSGAKDATATKKVLITGVSKGLGRALALELANRGHTIIGCSRDQTKLHSLQQELAKVSSAKHLLYTVDVRSNTNVEEFVQAIVENELVPNIIVNNAGLINRNGKIWELDAQEFDNVIDTNVKGIANIMRHFIPLMISTNKGIIINMSSLSGRDAHGLFAPYCASKWGVEGLSKATAKEVPEGMAIVSLDPGIIYTDMLVSCLGELALKYQSPQHWASKAATMILNLTALDNGASLTVEDPGTLPKLE